MRLGDQKVTCQGPVVNRLLPPAAEPAEGVMSSARLRWGFGALRVFAARMPAGMHLWPLGGAPRSRRLCGPATLVRPRAGCRGRELRVAARVPVGGPSSGSREPRRQGRDPPWGHGGCPYVLCQAAAARAVGRLAVSELWAERTQRGKVDVARAAGSPVACVRGLRPAPRLASGTLPPRGDGSTGPDPRQGRLPASLRDGLRPALTRALVRQIGSAMRKGRGVCGMQARFPGARAPPLEGGRRRPGPCPLSSSGGGWLEVGLAVSEPDSSHFFDRRR